MDLTKLTDEEKLAHQKLIDQRWRISCRCDDAAFHTSKDDAIRIARDNVQYSQTLLQEALERSLKDATEEEKDRTIDNLRSIERRYTRALTVLHHLKG